MKKRYLAMLLATALGVLLLTSVALGQGTYEFNWHSVDGGGGVSTGSTFTVHGTVGQPDAGVLGSGEYTLASGFWGGMAVEYRVYLPLVLRAYE